MIGNTNIVNINYVAYIAEKDGRLEIQTCDTQVPMDCIETLRDMWHDEGCSLLKMQDEVIAKLPKTVPTYIDYLAPISCSTAYVSAIVYPKRKNEEEYQRLLSEAEEKAAKMLKERLDEKYPREEDEGARRREFNERVVAARHEARKGVNQSMKCEYFLSARRYLYAWYYTNSITVNRIKERLKSDVKMYSTDTIGFTHFTYPVSKDVVIRVHTNFGYGVASYFRLELVYKGIPILPYSFYVNYYYANSRELASYTRLYRPERENWLKAFSFVVDTANLAAADPVRFVREWVMNEVATMVEGLKKIMKDPATYMGMWLDKMCTGNEESPYLHVRKMDYAAAHDYECYPFEMAIDFKSKKISGALDFLDSLEDLKPIFSDVDKSIAVIKDLGRKIIPEIDGAIESISCDIRNLGSELKKWQDQRAGHEVPIKARQAEIRRIVDARLARIDHRKWDNSRMHNFKVDVVEEYERNHPEYVEHCKERDKCLKEETRLEEDIANRKRFKSSLESSRVRIMSEKL